jgi:cobalamin biosynthesis protein CobT
VQVVSGPKACINKNHTVYLPPLPKDATEKDFIKYFHLGTHEQSHIYGGSNFERASKDRTHFKLENALEDVRCEQLQEKEYPGLKPYRIRFYEDCLVDFANDEFIKAEPDNILKFISTLGKYIIVKARMVQLDMPHLKLTPSESLVKAYYKHVSDLENRIICMSTTDDMFELSGIIYDRLKDLIREDAQKKAEEKAKEENKPKPQQEDKDDNENSDEADEGGAETSDSVEPDESDDGGSSGEEEEGDDQGDNGGNEGDDTSGSDDNQGDNERSEGGEDSTADGEDETSVKTDSCEDETNGGVISGEEIGDDIDPEEIEKEVDKVIDDLNKADDSMDITTDITKEINDASDYQSPYMVKPSVKDDINFGKETTDSIACRIRTVGLEMLGPKGPQLTKIFVSQTKPRMNYNRSSGNLDVRSLAADALDNRKDIYKNMTAARLDKAAVTFLMDNSGSMENNIGSTYAILSGILTLMSRACIPTEAIGYTIPECSSTVWRDVPAILTIIKEFKESFNGKVMRRCVRPSYLGCTNDIDGLRFAVPRLWARPEKKKVIMILCDGVPEMGNPELTRKVTQAYKEYIEICRKAGIILFGIGINVDLSHFFGNDCAKVSTSNVGEILLTKLTAILNRG